MGLTPLGPLVSILSGRAVVKIRDPSKIPSLGSKAYAKGLQKPVGVVADIIGPVRSPYAVIKLYEGALLSSDAEVLYEPARRGRR